MAKLKGQSELISQALYSHFPEPNTVAVAAAPIGGDEQPLGGWITVTAHFEPPVANTLHRVFGRVMIGPDTHPSGIQGGIVHPIRVDLAQLAINEIMGPHRLRLPAWLPFPPFILEVAHQLLLLGVDRDHRLTALLIVHDLPID